MPLAILLVGWTSLQPLERAAGADVKGRVTIMTVDGDTAVDPSNVVVFLEGVSAPGPVSGPSVMAQNAEAFQPGVLPIVAGSRVEFPNTDRVFHNIFSVSKTRPFDLGVYPPGETHAVTFPSSGLVKTYCNIHPDMTGYILVLNNSLFAVTDSTGTFNIQDVPEGEYVLRAWHRLGGDTRITVRSDGQSDTVVDLTVEEDRIAVPHLNKFGRRYRRKY